MVGDYKSSSDGGENSENEYSIYPDASVGDGGPDDVKFVGGPDPLSPPPQNPVRQVSLKILLNH